MEEAQPLEHRVLRRVKVLCPQRARRNCPYGWVTIKGYDAHLEFHRSTDACSLLTQSQIPRSSSASMNASTPTLLKYWKSEYVMRRSSNDSIVPSQRISRMSGRQRKEDQRNSSRPRSINSRQQNSTPGRVEFTNGNQNFAIERMSRRSSTGDDIRRGRSVQQMMPKKGDQMHNSMPHLQYADGLRKEISRIES